MRTNKHKFRDNKMDSDHNLGGKKSNRRKKVYVVLATVLICVFTLLVIDFKKDVGEAQKIIDQIRQGERDVKENLNTTYADALKQSGLSEDRVKLIDESNYSVVANGDKDDLYWIGDKTNCVEFYPIENRESCSKGLSNTTRLRPYLESICIAIIGLAEYADPKFTYTADDYVAESDRNYLKKRAKQIKEAKNPNKECLSGYISYIKSADEAIAKQEKLKKEEEDKRQKEVELLHVSQDKFNRIYNGMTKAQVEEFLKLDGNSHCKKSEFDNQYLGPSEMYICDNYLTYNIDGGSMTIHFKNGVVTHKTSYNLN